MKWRKAIYTILISLCALLFFASIICNASRTKNEFIRDISLYSFNDTIIEIYNNKDDFGTGTVTKLFGKTSDRFCFYGINDSTGFSYPSFAKKGDIIIKERYSDTFYLKRNGKTYQFSLEK